MDEIQESECCCDNCIYYKDGCGGTGTSENVCFEWNNPYKRIKQTEVNPQEEMDNFKEAREP